MPSVAQLLAYLRGTRAEPVPPPGVPLCSCGRPAITGEGAAVCRACLYRGAAIAGRPADFTTDEIVQASAGSTDVVRLVQRPVYAHAIAGGFLCVHRTLAWEWTADWPADDTVVDLDRVRARLEALGDAVARSAAIDHWSHRQPIDGCLACADEAFFRGRRAS